MSCISGSGLILIWLYCLYCLPSFAITFIKTKLGYNSYIGWFENSWKFSTVFYIVIGLSIYFF